MTDGCSRVWRQPHLWCSAPEAAPWLELRWDTPRTFDTILLYLDPELSMEIPSSRTDHWEDHHKFAARKGMPPQLMRDVSVQALTENGWQTVARCTGNWRLLELSAGEAVTATAQIALPEEGVPAIQTVEYDWKDEELDIDFFERVDYRELKVELTDQSGAVYDVRVLESDSDSLEVRAEGLDYGATYTITVSGVSLYGEDDYRSVSMEFEAVDR